MTQQSLFGKTDVDKFDSNEEIYFSWFTDELLKHGVAKEVIHHPAPFELYDGAKMEVGVALKTKTKYEERSLLQPVSYTTDYYIEWNEKFLNTVFVDIDQPVHHHSVPFYAHKFKQGYGSYIEVKGTFQGQHKSGQITNLMRKWTQQRHGIFVQVVTIGQTAAQPAKPKRRAIQASGHLFEQTFTPLRYLQTDGGDRARKFHYNPIMINDWLKRVDPDKHIFDD